MPRFAPARAPGGASDRAAGEPGKPGSQRPGRRKRGRGAHAVRRGRACRAAPRQRRGWPALAMLSVGMRTPDGESTPPAAAPAHTRLSSRKSDIAVYMRFVASMGPSGRGRIATCIVVRHGGVGPSGLPRSRASRSRFSGRFPIPARLWRTWAARGLCSYGVAESASHSRAYFHGTSADHGAGRFTVATRFHSGSTTSICLSGCR